MDFNHYYSVEQCLFLRVYDSLSDRVYFFFYIILRAFILPGQELLLYHTGMLLFDVNYYLKQKRIIEAYKNPTLICNVNEIL